MKRSGPRHSFAERLLMQQVAEEFSAKKDELGAAKAAKSLGVCLASFYKYVGADDLPKPRVLRRATELWKIKWKHLDPSQIVPPLRSKTPQQYVFSFLKNLREEDIEIVEVGPESGGTLQISIRIRFPVEKT